MICSRLEEDLMETNERAEGLSDRLFAKEQAFTDLESQF